jgi:hypothetical protein
MGGSRARWIEAYYWTTLLFVVLDGVFGANVRAAGLAEHPDLRVAYYVLCLGCAVVVHVRPSVSGLVGLAESSGNLVVLILSILLPYWAVADAILADRPMVQSPIGVGHVVNFVIAGTVWSILFYDQMLRIDPGSPSTADALRLRL